MPSLKTPAVVGLGEALFDVFPDRKVLGGAPLNVAAGANQLLAALAGSGIVAGRVGNDELGRELHQEMSDRGLETDYVQIDQQRPTGQVNITIESGQPEYDICTPAAWDAMQFDHRWVELARRCSAVCFGTLAQRRALSREAIGRFLSMTSSFKLFDVNLRQEFFSSNILRDSMQAADAVKLNSEELVTVASTLEMDSMQESDSDEDSLDELCRSLCKLFDLRFVARTRGKQGTVLIQDGQRLETEPARYEPEPDADAVGAGDACSAGLLVGHILNWNPEQSLQLANHMGAFVASVPGATPELPQTIKAMVSQ